MRALTSLANAGPGLDPREKPGFADRIFKRMYGGRSVTFVLAAVGFPMVAAIWLGVARTGPLTPPGVQGLEDFNDKSKEVVGLVNSKIKHALPWAKGNCSAMQFYKPGRTNPGHCANVDKPLATFGVNDFTSQFAGQIVWAEGIDALRVQKMRISEKSISNTTTEWSVQIDASFPNLNIWLKVWNKFDGKNVMNKFACCDKDFTFRLVATSNCTAGVGFSTVGLTVPHLDKIDYKKEWHNEAGDDLHWGLQVDMGENEKIHNEIVKFLTLRRGRMYYTDVRNEVDNAPPSDLLNEVGNVLTKVFEVNTDSACPRVGGRA